MQSDTDNSSRGLGTMTEWVNQRAIYWLPNNTEHRQVRYIAAVQQVGRWGFAVLVQVDSAVWAGPYGQ